MNIISETCCAH